MYLSATPPYGRWACALQQQGEAQRGKKSQLLTAGFALWLIGLKRNFLVEMLVLPDVVPHLVFLENPSPEGVSPKIPMFTIHISPIPTWLSALQEGYASWYGALPRVRAEAPSWHSHHQHHWWAQPNTYAQQLQFWSFSPRKSWSRLGVWQRSWKRGRRRCGRTWNKYKGYFQLCKKFLQHKVSKCTIHSLKSSPDAVRLLRLHIILILLYGKQCEQPSDFSGKGMGSKNQKYL